ncbi:hypothetical protein KJ708_05475, partial [bacterium]|nr:hypothetical protein [bacterium]
MITNTVILPIIIPFLTAVMLLVWRRPSVSRRLFVGLASLFVFAVSIFLSYQTYHHGVHVLRFGGWQPPFGIALTVDLLSAIMLSLSGFIVFCSVLYGFAQQAASDENPLRFPLVLFLLAGMNMAFATGDIFNLYVAFEVMLISSYALMTLEADKGCSKHALPYVTINVFGSAIFLMAAGLTYSLLGTLNYADIALRASQYVGDPRLTVIALMFATVFGIKSGVFPLYYWLPKSYPILPAPLAGLYGGMLTKVGVYCFIRLFCTILPHDLVGMHWLLAIMAGPTMIFGVIGAMSKGSIRSILSYHIISQVGFMLLACGFFTPFGVAASIFYVVHHIIVKSSLFLIGGIGAEINGSDELNKMGHLWGVAPIVGIVFLIQALSLAGLPPLSGFWGKYMIVLTGIKLANPVAYILVACSILAGVWTLVSMLKIWL